MSQNEAFLSSQKIDSHSFTIFRYQNYTIRFRAPYSLEQYTAINEWDHGYIAVMAKYQHNALPEEEYIDLVPILQDLYFDADAFLLPIEKVSVLYD